MEINGPNSLSSAYTVERTRGHGLAPAGQTREHKMGLGCLPVVVLVPLSGLQRVLPAHAGDFTSLQKAIILAEDNAGRLTHPDDVGDPHRQEWQLKSTLKRVPAQRVSPSQVIDGHDCGQGTVWKCALV